MNEKQLMAIKEYLENDADLVSTVYELNSYNNCLDEYNYYNMEDFDEILCGQSPTWIAERIFYGDFKPCDDCFQFDGYGNLQSCDRCDIEEELSDNIDEIITAIQDIPYSELPTDLQTVIDEAGEEEDE